MVFILIFSLISVSVAGSGNGIDSQRDTGVNPEQKVGADSANKTLEQKQGNGSTDWIENQENNEEKLEQEDNKEIKGTGNSIDTKEESGQKDNSGTKLTENQKNNEERIENEDEDSADRTENLEKEDDINKGDQQNTDEKLKQESSETGNTDDQKNSEEKVEQKQEDKNSTESYENSTESPGNQENERDNIEQKQEENNSTDSNIDSNIDSNTGSNRDSPDNKESDNEKIGQENEGNNSTGSTDNQENSEEKVEQKQEENNSTDSSIASTDKKESNNEKIGQKQEGNNSINSTGNQESNEEKTEQNIKVYNGSIKTRNVTKTLEDLGTKSEIKIKACNRTIKACNGTYSRINEEVKTEAKTGACNGTQNPVNGGTKNETKQGSFNFTCLPAQATIPEVKPEISSLDNMKFVLEYPYLINSFYTTQETVNIYYNGPEALSQQKVDIYLVKERNPDVSEEPVRSITDKETICFEEVFSNAESYIQVPASLNDGGDLLPMTLGPLPAGDYWVLITRAGNETNTSEPEKQILLANNFKVLEYELRVKAPATLNEGKSFEINLELENASAQESYTYLAVLIREDAYAAKINDGSNETRKKIDPFLKEFDIIKFFGINSTNFKPKAVEDEFKSKIQALIGEGNGTVSIGEENQNTLSLTSLDLSPGNYILFAGAYEKNKGLVGVVQEEMTITAARKGDSPKSYSLEHNSNTFPIIRSKASVPATLTTEKSVFETIKTFKLDELQSHIQERAMEVIRNPPKLPSFLVGFTGTLLIMLTIIKIMKKTSK